MLGSRQLYLFDSGTIRLGGVQMPVPCYLIDHTGALGHFPSAAVVIHEHELDAARAADRPIASGYQPRDYASPHIPWKLLDGELDLYGDGAITLLQTPGHAAGHMSVLVRLDRTGPVLLTADAADNVAQWEGSAPLRALFSREQATASVERLHDLAIDTGALIVFGHDPNNWAGHRHAPDCYS
jgi:N-acyl homoserine lactone hydrolase